MGDVSFTAQTRFESNMRLELNQQKSLLFPTAMTRNVAGAEKTKLDNLVSNHQPRRKTARGQAVTQDNTAYDGIWVAKDDPYYLATFQDTEDQLLTAVDLKGSEVMAHAGTIARAKDIAFLTGFFGDMITGKSGTVLNAFPAGNIVAKDHDGITNATGTALGMSVAKLRRARRILARNFVDMSQTFYVGLTSLQIEELTADAKAIDADYANAVKPMWSADGKSLLSIAGFMIIEIELGNPLFGAAADLTFDVATGCRKCPFWTADGMVAAIWEELFSRVSEDDTKHYAYQVYSRTDLVCSRTDNNRCGYILCKEV